MKSTYSLIFISMPLAINISEFFYSAYKMLIRSSHWRRPFVDSLMLKLLNVNHRFSWNFGDLVNTSYRSLMCYETNALFVDKLEQLGFLRF
jgi:hypothetical protein